MKANIKTRWIAISICILAISGIIGILIWYSGYSRQEEHKSMINQTTQNIPAEPLKQSWKRPSFGNEYTSNNLVSQQAGNQRKKDGQAPEAGASIDLISKSPEAAEEFQETPAEMLQRYLKVTNSPEFIEEFRNVSIPLEAETYPFLDQMKELEDSEKELERKLEMAFGENKSKIQNKLEEVKANLWEARVEYFEKVTLLGDAVHRVFLNHFTNEEIRTAREEMWRTMAPPSGAFINDAAKELTRKAAREAIARLKAKGWVPANPDERWYVN